MKNSKIYRFKAVPFLVICTTMAMAFGSNQAMAEGGAVRSSPNNAPVYMTFDWHANGRSQGDGNLYLANSKGKKYNWQFVSQGNGSHICSISGAGQRSRCYSR